MRIKLKKDGPLLAGRYDGTVAGRRLELKAGDIVEGTEVGALVAAYPDDFEFLRDAGPQYQTRIMGANRGAR